MYCTDITPPLFFLFSNSVPELLYYSHIPTVIISLIVGIFVLFKTNFSFLSRMLFSMILCFSLWCFFSLIVWTNLDSRIIMFFWSFFGLLYILIYFFSIQFVYFFINQRQISFVKNLILLVFMLPIIVLLPTRFYLGGFDLKNCESTINNSYYNYYYILGIFFLISIILIILKSYKTNKRVEDRKQFLLLGIGITFFLLSFFVSGYIAAIIDNFKLEQYGLFGMTIFMAFLAYLIVKFKAFDIKLIATQALVWGVLILVGSQFFFIKSTINLVLNGITLVISSALGLVIIRGVKREIALREDLEVANRNQESLIHFVSHQLKGFFTKSKMIFAGIVEGDFGESSETLKDVAKEGLLSDDNAVSMIQDILGASNLKKGTTTYNMKEVNFSEVVKKVCGSFTKEVVDRGLELKCNVPDVPMKILADSTQIDQVVKNLIDNSLKYTPKGSVEISLSLEKKDGKDKVLLVIKDTGIGLSESDKKKLFTEGGKGDESLKVNVNSTGYGLYIVKKIVENHGGKIWAESDGRGMGSRFYVELGRIA